MKKSALRLLRNCGGFAVSRAVSAKMARILMFHNFCEANDQKDDTTNDAVSIAALRSQISYLQRHFQVVPLARIVDQVKFGKSLDDRLVALTIDDGRRNCYECLFPLLKEFALPATFFVVSSFIAREDWVWTDKVLWLKDQPSRSKELSPGMIGNLFLTLNQLRPEARDARISAIAAGMGVSIPTRAPEKYAPCSWKELREMADSGLVEIGSHTATHAILASITDEESWHELTHSRSTIENGVGREVRAFCFPNGKPGDYRPRQIQQLMDAGYTSAVVASPGMVVPKSKPYELPRIGVSGYTSELSFAKEVDAVEYYQAKLRNVFVRGG